jgi:hypothetical protein
MRQEEGVNKSISACGTTSLILTVWHYYRYRWPRDKLEASFLDTRGNLSLVTRLQVVTAAQFRTSLSGQPLMVEFPLWMFRAILFEFSCRNQCIFCYYYPSLVEAVAAALAVAVMKMISTLW